MKFSPKSMVLVTATLVLIAATLFMPLAVSASGHSERPVALAEDAAVAVAVVTEVDQKTRKITLRGPEGDKFMFTAGPEVRNFDQIKRGDRLMVAYYEGFALALGPKGSGVKDKASMVDVERAKPGEKPGVSVTETTVAVGVVKAVDHKNRTVTLQGPERTISLEAAENVDLSTVKVGDSAEAVYIQSYAAQVVPAPKVSATLELETTSVAVGVGVQWGHGTLTLYDGSTHKVKINGLSVVDLGVSKVKASGEVFNLVELVDLNGTFFAGQAGIALGPGRSATAMKNANGVVIQLKSSQKGARLTLAPEGLTIKVEE
jgi:Cu/Ag efflux protein CusF